MQNFNYSCKILIITAIFNVETNELTLYAKIFRNFTMFYWRKIIYVKCRKNWERPGIENEVFRFTISLKKYILTYSFFCIFEIISIYLNIVQRKYPKTVLIHSAAQIKQAYEFPFFFFFALDNFENWFKVFVNCRCKIVM